jgi:hypothetical protein
MKKFENIIYNVILFFLLIFISLISFPIQTHAIEPKLTDILITNDVENVLLYARLVNGFKPDVEMAVLAGIPAIFTMKLEVYQERSFSWDKKISSQEIKRVMKYDNLMKKFSVLTNNKTEPLIFSDFESAQKAMADFNGIVAAPLSALTKGRNYYAIVKLKMDKARLPLNMEYVFFFVSLWDFETSWYRQNFSY